MEIRTEGLVVRNLSVERIRYDKFGDVVKQLGLFVLT